jgi:tetratricopeptide (TPR) repeat protein
LKSNSNSLDKVLAFILICVSTLCAQRVEELVTAGDALDEKHRNSEALSLYLKADGQKPNDAEILRRLSKQYAQLMLDAKSASEKRQLGEKGLDAAQRAVTANPNNTQTHLSLAIFYGRIALDEPARRKVEMSSLIRQEAETAARLDPKNDYAWHVLGRWNYELANFNPFLKALAQAIYGKLPDASNEKAVEYFSKAIALQPRRVAHHLELGRAYLALGEKQKARAQFNKGLPLPSTEKDDDDNKQRARATLEQLQ